MRKQELKREDSDDQEIENDGNIDLVNSHQQPFPPNNLPACQYCRFIQQSSLAKCLNKHCNKIFCNTKGKQSGSHIVMHLVKAKHNEICKQNQLATYDGNDLGKVTIECYICGNKNLFTLGSVDVKTGKEEQVIILCRNPCMMKTKYNQLQWEIQQWKPLIEQKVVVDWLLDNTVPVDYKFKIRQIKNREIANLQQVWKTNPNTSYDQLYKQSQKLHYKPLQMFYKNGDQYRSIFQPLLNLQAQTDRKIKESQTQTGVSVKFEMNSKKVRFASFKFASKDDFQYNLLPGNQLKLSIKTDKYDWQSKGIVIKIYSNQQIYMQLQEDKAPPPIQVGYKVQFVWKSTSYSRMIKGLKHFVQNHYSISSYLFYKILGQERDIPPMEIEPPKQKEISAPKLPILNPFQKEALIKSFTQPLCLIQGPPGTGKTITSASIIYHLVNNKKRKSKILVCAPSNVVVDMLAQRINMTGVNVLRFCSKTRQTLSSSIQPLTLHFKIKNSGKYNQLYQKKELNKEEDIKMKSLKKQAEKQIISQSDVICCTCIASADPRLQSFSFYHVLIDQATQAIQPQCLLPMLKSAKHIILVGDHQQLGPVVISQEATKAGLNKSLFERLVLLGHKPIRLQVQYRMHPMLSLFPSNNFYQGSLQNGVTIMDRKLNKNFPWPDDKPLFFFNVYGTQQISASGTSYLNRIEANAIQKIVYYLGNSGIQSSQIGIITPYKGQRAYIINTLFKNGQTVNKNPYFYSQLEISSVDGYQGREKDYIVISCVRSNQGAGIGFLIDPRRLNVMLTRARNGLIVVGNAKVLSRVKGNAQKNYWNKLLCHFKQINTLVQGNIPNFKQSNIVIKQIEKENVNEVEEEQNIPQEEISMKSGVRYSTLAAGFSNYRQ